MIKVDSDFLKEADLDFNLELGAGVEVGVFGLYRNDPTRVLQSPNKLRKDCMYVLSDCENQNICQYQHYCRYWSWS